MAKAGGDAADQAGKAAQKTGLQVEAYGKLAFAANQADVSNEQFVSGMSRLNKAIAEAADETKKTGDVIDATGVKVTRFGGKTKDAAKQVDTAGNVFAKLGVKIKDANGKLRSNEAIIGDVAEAFSRMPDSALKSALAIELFGKAGAELLPFLNEGRDGLKALGDEATRLGIVFTKEQATIGDDLGDALDEVGKAAAGTRLQLGLLFAPAVTELARGLRDILISNRDTVLQFGQAAARTFASVAGDLLHLISGNSQNIKNPWIRDWSVAIIQFGRDFLAVVQTVVLPLFKGIHDGAQAVAEAINGMFGTNVSGGQLLIGVALLQLLGVFNLIVSTSGAVIAALRLIGTVVATMFGEGVIAAATGFFGAIFEGATAFLGLVAGLISWPALLVAALVAAGIATVVFWDDIVAGARTAIAAIQDLFSPGNLTAVFSGLLEGAKIAGQLFVEAWKLQIQAVGVVFQGLAQIVTGFVEGVVSAISGLAAQLLPSWTQIGVDGGSVWSTILGLASQALTGIVGQVTALAGLLAPVWDGIALAGSAVWTTIGSAAATAFTGLTTIATTAISAVSDTIGSLIGAVVDSFTGATSQVVQAANAIAAAIARATEISGDVSGASALADALVAPFRQAQAAIDQIMAGIRNVVQTGFSSLIGIVRSLASQIQSEIARIIAQLQAAARAAAALRAKASGSGGGGSSEQGLAGGGQIRGPGGPTGDRIPAWLSDTEFVMQAKAVRKYGTRFMYAVNNGLLSLKSLRMPSFNVGGMLDGFNRSMAIPRFASGGLADMNLAPAAPSGGAAGTMRVQLDFGLGPADIFDMVTDTFTANRFQQFALKEANSSAGRAPSRGK
ncbi:hypothetical protein X740_33170 [Mesorhizobium sp. LNHC221B00]|uniref:hypothetical protein n=1 Tax=Mesorhizobium sp. LNHC221B00 TaxID=1287233 RepID=UPI0003CE25F5|nr:hypothetical protein [Mesorhizobium sp. LNHC221B00]ESY72515.1 hypothetical protein X740_33170 [Mesorhizobium sp. LNHC221B00]